MRVSLLCISVVSLWFTSCVTSSSMLHSSRLPLAVRIVEDETGLAVPGASVELQWRSGVQGYYWGEPVTRVTDEAGKVQFGTEDVRPVSSDGYSLGKDIHKVFVSTIVVSAPGYQNQVLKYPSSTESIEITLRRISGGLAQ